MVSGIKNNYYYYIWGYELRKDKDDLVTKGWLAYNKVSRLD
jgi:hypothetical protein